MGQHPLNLAVRFLLEMGAVVSMSYWGSTLGEGLVAAIGAIGVPLLGMTVWGVFRVPGDPGNAPVAVPGVVRLMIEFVFFGASVWMQAVALSATIAVVFGVVVLGHYVVSYDRVRWLLVRHSRSD